MKNPWGAAMTAAAILLTADVFVNKEESLIRRLFKQLGWD